MSDESVLANRWRAYFSTTSRTTGIFVKRDQMNFLKKSDRLYATTPPMIAAMPAPTSTNHILLTKSPIVKTILEKSGGSKPLSKKTFAMRGKAKVTRKIRMKTEIVRRIAG